MGLAVKYSNLYPLALIFVYKFAIPWWAQSVNPILGRICPKISDLVTVPSTSEIIIFSELSHKKILPVIN